MECILPINNDETSAGKKVGIINFPRVLIGAAAVAKYSEGLSSNWRASSEADEVIFKSTEVQNQLQKMIAASDGEVKDLFLYHYSISESESHFPYERIMALHKSVAGTAGYEDSSPILLPEILHVAENGDPNLEKDMLLTGEKIIYENSHYLISVKPAGYGKQFCYAFHKVNQKLLNNFNQHLVGFRKPRPGLEL
jgi:23S rRNA-/tRNA-specific pseudouridylate synthase